MNPEAEIVNNTRLIYDGFVYHRSKLPKNNKTHWECRLLRKGECSARATTRHLSDGSFTVQKGVQEHSHEPNREFAEAEKIKMTLKRKAEAHPEEPPAGLLRKELAGVSSGVLSQLPERESLKKTIRAVRAKNLPTNPTSIAELGELPNEYTKTVTGDNFLIYDSINDEELDLENRIIVFATRRNIELLSQSSIWFLDGTFKVAPHIFTQLFTVMGTVTRRSETGKPEVVPLPFVYALLSSKETCQYEIVLRAITSVAKDYGIGDIGPEMIMMTDFELGIINACKTIYPYVAISCCFFHLWQNIYRNIQSHGLQGAYNDPHDRTIKKFTKMLAALAFVPISDVECYFAALKAVVPDTMSDFVNYFDSNYLTGNSKFVSLFYIGY